MKIISFTFINRYSKTRRWLTTPRSFRDVILPENGIDAEHIAEFDNLLFNAAVKCSDKTIGHTLPTFINVYEKKLEVNTPWYLRALIVGESKELEDLTTLTAKINSVLENLDSDHALKKVHDAETNDLRNSIWAIEVDDCLVFLTYNKNVVRRIQVNFSALAAQHILELQPKAV